MEGSAFLLGVDVAGVIRVAVLDVAYTELGLDVALDVRYARHDGVLGTSRLWNSRRRG